MSYDLYLFPEGPFDRRAFAVYFEGREHYTLSDGGRRALYKNPDTGVYFSFQYAVADQRAANTARRAGWPEGDAIAFTVKYFRPHVFGLEALEEVRDLVLYFDCEVRDPQRGGMGEDWSEEGFLRGWGRDNEFGYGLIADHCADEDGAAAPRACVAATLKQSGCLLAPGGLIEAVWRWNRGRAALQERFGDDFFVPTLLWGAPFGSSGFDAKPVTFVTWAPHLPILMPAIATHAILGLPTPDTGRLGGALAKFGRRGGPRGIRHYLAPVADLKLEAGPASSAPGAEAIAIPHGPARLPKAALDRLEANWPMNEAKGQFQIYKPGKLRNAEIVERVVSGAH